MSEMFLSSPDNGWVSPQMLPYGAEAHLQDLLLAAPHVIPGIDEPVAICKEFSTGAGPADLLVINSQGEITIIECKLRYNSESRREIFGQILDYASSLWNMPIQTFLAQWQSSAGNTLDGKLGKRVDSIIESVSKHLEAGRFNLMLAVDEINPKLERIVTYLNRVTKTEISVYAVEFKRVSVGATEVLLPVTFGLDQVEEKEIPTNAAEQWWPNDAFRTYLIAKHPSLVRSFDAIAGVVKENGGNIVGGGAAIENALVKQVVGGQVLWPVSFYAFNDIPSLQINFHYLKKNPHRLEFLECLAVDGGFDLDVEGIKSSGFSRKPKVELASITETQIVALREALRVLNEAEEVDE